MNGTGNILPIKHIINALIKSMCKIDAAINPPRNSTIGNIDTINTRIFLFSPLNKFIKKFTIDSVIKSPFWN